MIVASHQPNFMPYMGYFKKMYLCDVFTLSDAVQYSKRGYHNYNFINELGARTKITIPVHCDDGDKINNALLCNWEHNRKKLKKRLESCYRKAPHFNLYERFEPVLSSDYNHLYALNEDLIKVFYDLFGFDCKILSESLMDLQGDTATEQIVDICRKTNALTYLSGEGAKAYLNEDLLRDNGIGLLWSEYKPLEYGSVLNPSSFDYVMNCGATIPDEWKVEKERLRNGKDL